MRSALYTNRGLPLNSSPPPEPSPASQGREHSDRCGESNVSVNSPAGIARASDNQCRTTQWRLAKELDQASGSLVCELGVLAFLLSFRHRIEIALEELHTLGRRTIAQQASRSLYGSPRRVDTIPKTILQAVPGVHSAHCLRAFPHFRKTRSRREGQRQSPLALHRADRHWSSS